MLPCSSTGVSNPAGASEITVHMLARSRTDQMDSSEYSLNGSDYYASFQRTEEDPVDSRDMRSKILQSQLSDIHSINHDSVLQPIVQSSIQSIFILIGVIMRHN